jgi:uncharacterized membrane protein YeiB
MGVKAARFLTWTSVAAACISLVCLVLLLAYKPAAECLNSDYDSPTSPLHSGGVAFACLVYSVVATLVGAGVTFGLPSGIRRAGGRAVAVSVVALVVAGAAVFADAARWTCWP